MEGGHKAHRALVTIQSLIMAFLRGGAVLLLVSSCATVQTEPLASGELRLISMEVSQREEIKEKQPFVVTIRFEADGAPEILKACFFWSGRGPYCFQTKDIYYEASGMVRIQLPSRNPGRHFLEGYFVYRRDGKTQTTNVVGVPIRVFNQ